MQWNTLSNLLILIQNKIEVGSYPIQIIELGEWVEVIFYCQSHVSKTTKNSQSFLKIKNLCVKYFKCVLKNKNRTN
jgi:hypothetical protein